jgi:CheY-specific phosphatase CheX
MNHSIEPNLLGRLGADVMSAYFDEPFAPVGTRVPACSAAVIHLTGETVAHQLGVGCDRRLAAALARRLSLCEGPEPTQEDLDETVRELCNVLAGNLKSELAEEAMLSMPATTRLGDGVRISLASHLGAMEIVLA